MKLYKMKNGDIVTDIHVSTKRANAIRATRLYDATNKTYCCQRRVYTDGIDARMSSAQVAVFMRALDAGLRGHTTAIAEDIVSKLDIVGGWFSTRVEAARRKVHDLTSEGKD